MASTFSRRDFNELMASSVVAAAHIDWIPEA
jgi:hypothetical protein